MKKYVKITPTLTLSIYTECVYVYINVDINNVPSSASSRKCDGKYEIIKEQQFKQHHLKQHENLGV